MHTVRRKLHIVLFAIGLTMVISGLAIALGGPNIWFRWQPRSETMAEDAPLLIDKFDIHPGRNAYRLSPKQMSRDAADIRIEGNIAAEEGYRFNFAVLSYTYWIEWNQGEPYTAYVDTRNTTSTSFAFNLTEKPSLGGVCFGVENRNAHDIQTRLWAAISWKEKEILEPSIATIGLFTLAKFIAVVGFILIVAAAVMKLRRLDERPYRAPVS